MPTIIHTRNLLLSAVESVGTIMLICLFFGLVNLHHLSLLSVHPYHLFLMSVPIIFHPLLDGILCIASEGCHRIWYSKICLSCIGVILS